MEFKELARIINAARGNVLQRNLTNIALIVAAMILAAVPVVGLRWILNAHEEGQAKIQLEASTQRTLAYVDGVLAEAADVLGSVAETVHGNCDATQRARLSSAAFEAPNVKSIHVVRFDGRPLCSSSEILAGNILEWHSRSARQKNLSVGIHPENDGVRIVMTVSAVEADRVMVATLLLDLHRLDFVPSGWQSTLIGDITFDDGTAIGSLPARSEVVRQKAPEIDTDMFRASTSSERFPVRVTLSVPRATTLERSRVLANFVDLGGSMLGFLFFMFMIQVTKRVSTVEDAIARGIRRQEFLPYYQPVFDIQNGNLVGCEVLIRWRKQDGMIVPPGTFIREAEESGLAVEMTQQLMRHARDEVGPHYAARPDLKLAINLFADHFSDFTIVDDVREIFSTGGLRYSQLVFEVTERYPLPNITRAKMAIKGLQDLGCRVSLDDAGTGHGGLAYLQTLGMDQVKIDKLFVDTITTTTVGSPIVDSLIELGRSMNMEIVAEGLETREQLLYLKLRGVQFAQGYLFSKPLSGASYIELLNAMRKADTSENAPYSSHHNSETSSLAA